MLKGKSVAGEAIAGDRFFGALSQMMKKEGLTYGPSNDNMSKKDNKMKVG